jgi:tripartite-type tricarboxylate transporter receptor subunit TctC
MTIPRRQFLHLAVAAAIPAAPRLARAQTYPARPVRLVVGFPPGGQSDTFARLMGQWLSERLGQPFIIENRPGAGGNIATESVVRAAPDGHTLLQVSSTNTTSAALYDKLNYNFVRDIAPVASVARTTYVMEVNAAFPAKTIPEFIAYAKANPSKINMASADNGTVGHVAGEMFKLMTGVNITHVPYRGSSPALADLLGGQIQVSFSPMSASLAYIRAGRLRALGVTVGARLEALPDVPAIGEFLPGYEASSWDGIAAPRNTPAEIIARLNAEINAALADAKIKARLADLGAAPLPMTPVEFGKLIVADTEKWAKVIRAAHIKPE